MVAPPKTEEEEKIEKIALDDEKAPSSKGEEKSVKSISHEDVVIVEKETNKDSATTNQEEKQIQPGN